MDEIKKRGEGLTQSLIIKLAVSTIREAFTAACEIIECSLAEENSIDP